MFLTYFSSFTTNKFCIDWFMWSYWGCYRYLRVIQQVHRSFRSWYVRDDGHMLIWRWFTCWIIWLNRVIEFVQQYGWRFQGILWYSWPNRINFLSSRLNVRGNFEINNLFNTSNWFPKTSNRNFSLKLIRRLGVTRLLATNLPCYEGWICMEYRSMLRWIQR